MAHMEIATFVSTGKEFHANISTGVVDPDSKTNDKNDVMLIKAFINIIGFNPGRAENFFDIKPGDSLPDPNDGSLDPKTSRAIWRFQEKNWPADVLSLDGKIHQADYRFRKIKKGPLMTITLLNLHALGVGAMIFKSRNLRTLLLKISPGLLLPIRI